MLYQIIAPLALFASLGGLIFIISRIIMRRRRQEQNAEIVKLGEEVSSAQATRSLRPPKSRIYLARNQMSNILHYLWQFSHDSRKILKPGLRALTSKVIDRFSSLGKAIKKKMYAWRKRRQEKKKIVTSKPSTSPITAPASPVHVTSVHTPPPSPPARVPEPKRVTAKLVSPMFFRQAKPASPVHQAKQALEKGQAEEVEHILIPYIIHNVKDTEAYVILGQAALKQEHWTEAVEIFEQVIALHKEEPGAYAGLGYAAFRAGSYTKALPALQRALEADPHNTITIECLTHIARTIDNPALQQAIANTLNERREA